LEKSELKDRATAKRILNLGEPSTTSGFLVEPDTHLGQCDVIDLTQPWGNNTQQVDLRTIQWVVLKNVKYEVK